MVKKDFPAIEKWLDSVGVKGEGGRYFLATESRTKEIDPKGKTIVVTISTRGKDRLGDILDPEGVHLENFRKNPVVLWAHDYKRPPIAKSLWIKVDNEKIIAKAKFASTPLAQEIFSLYADGYLNAWSVGFIPDEYKTLKNANGDFEGYHISRWELLEYSAVPIPANPEALTNAIKKGLLNSEKLVRDFKFLENTGGVDLNRPALDEEGALTNSHTSAMPIEKARINESLSAIDYKNISEELMRRFAPQIHLMVKRAFRKRQGKID